MRIPAKALPCLLFCLACVTLAPASAALAAPLPKSTPGPHVGHAATTVGHHAHAAAHRRAKAHSAAPKIAASAPHDTSNRFLMTQGGKPMTADDFDAWMKSRGFRVAKGAPEAPKAAD